MEENNEMNNATEVERVEGEVLTPESGSDIAPVVVGAAVATVATVVIIAGEKFVVRPICAWFKRRALKKQAKSEIDQARASMTYEEQVAEFHDETETSEEN